MKNTGKPIKPKNAIVMNTAPSIITVKITGTDNDWNVKATINKIEINKYIIGILPISAGSRQNSEEK